MEPATIDPKPPSHDGLPDALRLGDARVDFERRQIDTVDGARQLDHKAMEVLRCLVAEGGRVVTKRDLIERVWSGAFVTDDVLTAAISRLRRALGDSSRQPHTIETVPSVGYRLIARVEPLEPIAARRWPKHLLAALVVLVIVATIAWSIARRDRSVASVPPRTLAVLPLDNLTGDPDQAFLAAGMTEAWISGFASHGSWRVIAPASVRRWIEDRPDLAEIADELGVDLLIEGSIQRSGDRLRVDARMTAADDLQLLWAGSFDGAADDVFGLQARAVTTMVALLGVDPAATPRAATARATWPTDPVAREAFLRARYLLAQPATRQRLSLAIEHLERVIAAQPDFASGHAALGEAFIALADAAWVPPEEAFRRARAAADEARRLDPSAARPIAIHAIVRGLGDWRLAEAEALFRQALDLDPDDLVARDGYSRLLTLAGRFDDALEQQRLVRELHPLIYHQPVLASIYNMARQHDAARRELMQQLILEPRSPHLHAHLASTLRWLGRPDEAIEPFLVSLRLGGAPASEIDAVAGVYEGGGVAGVGRYLIERYELSERAGRRVPAMSWAEARLLAGDVNGALNDIERAADVREPKVLTIGHSPEFDALRAEPRFQTVVARLGLPTVSS